MSTLKPETPVVAIAEVAKQKLATSNKGTQKQRVEGFLMIEKNKEGHTRVWIMEVKVEKGNV